MLVLPQVTEILICLPQKRKTNRRRSQQKAMSPLTDDVQIMLRATFFEMFETYNFVSLKFNLPVSCFRMRFEPVKVYVIS